MNESEKKWPNTEESATNKGNTNEELVSNFEDAKISMLKDYFDIEELGNSSIIISNKNEISGEEYHIKPKKGTEVTVKDLINLIKKHRRNKNTFISIDSAEVDETTPLIKLEDIESKFQRCKITGGTILFNDGYKYYCISTGFEPEESKN